MIQIHNLHLSFGGDPIFNGLTWTIRFDRRYGLIGPNGAGKSTLLKVLAGRQVYDDGTVALGDATVGYLAQDVQDMDIDRTVRDEALRAFADVLALEDEEHRLTAEMAKTDDHESDAYHKLLHDFDRVHTTLVTKEVHTIRPRTDAVLTGLGFAPDDLERPLATFSGGWRMRAALARLLLMRPDVLLLDEPTNHLDIDSIAWIESYLKGYPGAVIIVSHDRYFLDRMVNHIAELSRGQVTEYAGNYAYYLTEREERRTLQQASYENQQKQINETERFIERFRYKASKARQVQSRIKLLEKLERIPPPPSDEATINLRFPSPRRSGRTVLELTQFSKTYESMSGPIEVFDRAGPLLIERGDKIALIGKNGAGKSTLARIIYGTEPFEGTRKLGHQVDLTFFAQHQADELDPRDTVLESLRAKATGQSETELRTLLGTFLFQGDDVFKPVGVLSGGEKSRVALARTLLTPANFLLLDEPTNHLDIQSINVLIEAMQQYAGTFVVVSHDRHFLDQVINKVWRVEEGTVRAYTGNYTEYRWQIEHGTAAKFETATTNGTAAAEAEAAATEDRQSGPKTKEQKRREADERRRRREQMKRTGKLDPGALNDYQLQQMHDEVEAKIDEKETRKTEIEAALADPKLYTDPRRANRLHEDYDALEAELPKLYEQWEALAEERTEREAG